MPYNYTKPRAPIAAMYASPGPAVYQLPELTGQSRHDPRSGHNRNPAYPFGVRHGKFRDDCSPGPCYQPTSKIYKDGKDGTPHYSLYARHPELAGFKVPGPGAYSPEKVGPSAKRAPPQYSFGLRPRHRKNDNSPAPNTYSLDPMIGGTVQSVKRSAPLYSLRSRTAAGNFCEDLSKTPGPGTYNIVTPDIYKNKQPYYSMTSRNMMPGDNSQKPGPGAHSPEKVHINKRIAPACSFGIRHSEYTAPLIIDPVE